MKPLNVIFLFLIVLLCSCSSKDNQLNLHDDPYLTKYFTTVEIAELEKIISFTDSCVMTNNKYQEVNPAYYYIIDSMWYDISSVDGFGLIPINEKMKYKFLFNLDTNLFNKIWYKYTPGIISSYDTTLYNPDGLISLEVNNNGDYVEMLEELGRSNAYFKDVSKGIQSAGGISPSVVSGFRHHARNMDFNEVQNRLWAAIFLLAMEESTQVRVERYLNETKK